MNFFMIRCLRVCFHNSGDFSEINWGELNLRWGDVGVNCWLILG